MAKIKSKMIVALSFLSITLFLAVSFWVFYFSSVDAKVVARANYTSKVAGAEALNKSQGRDLTKELKLEYALTNPQRAVGLMNRGSLCEDCGMLFVFENSQELSFWMKNTLIPLDIIFISREGVVTNIESATPELINKNDGDYITYKSNGEAIYVLEVNQGWSEKNQLKAGDRLNLNTLIPKN
jgi:uncharacterized membrane protein (UPF0127 family)